MGFIFFCARRLGLESDEKGTSLTFALTFFIFILREPQNASSGCLILARTPIKQMHDCSKNAT